MKIKFKKLFFALMLAVSLPIVSFLTGCGATPSNKLTGILFDTMQYDEATGLPVFMVDKDVTTSLDYKIYPSSASGYKVYFDPIDKGTAENSSRFTFQDGTINIHSASFEEVKYKVRAGEYSDTCIIRLKEYPVEISTDKPTMVVNSFDIGPINVQARFVNSIGVVTTKNITEGDFDFVVETSDETILQVPNENRLKFCPVRNGRSNAEITVTLLNGQGEKTNMSFKISVQVIQRISNSFVTLSGVSTMVENGDTAEVNFNSLATENGMGRIDLNVYPINVGNLLVGDEFTYSLNLSSKKYAKISADGKYILIDSAIPNDEKLQIQITIVDMTMDDGSTFVIDLNLIIKKI
ncbi:MAG: hypothetical protein IKJ33_05620 [Clostridia bacterium]|nr:hypothetical protein [Clostridia bacterium]